MRQCIIFQINVFYISGYHIQSHTQLIKNFGTFIFVLYLKTICIKFFTCPGIIISPQRWRLAFKI
jgi:hypothetical protein